MMREAWRDFLDVFEAWPGMQFWIKDRQGRFVLANREFLEHFGMKRMESLVGRTDFDVSPAELAREYVRHDQVVLATGKPVHEQMELVRERDGRYAWYSTTKVPLRNDKGEVWGTAGITRKSKEVGAPPGTQGDLESAVHAMKERFAEPISIAELAESAGMSLALFERRFRRTFRTTPLRYLNGVRIRAACALLTLTSLPIREVARQCGSADPGYFAKQFHRAKGMSPRDYRIRFSQLKSRP